MARTMQTSRQKKAKILSSSTSTRRSSGENGGDLGANAENAVAVPQLPEEILQIIFTMLAFSSQSPETDLQSVCTAAPHFNRILHPSKVMWLFKDIFPHLYQYLDKASILTCRQVSIFWNRGVDQHLQNLACFYDNTNPLPPTLSTLQSHNLEPLRLDEDLLVTQFSTEMSTTSRQQTGRNPFPFGSLYLTRDAHEPEDFNNFWNASVSLLSSLGHHLTSIHLYPQHSVEETILDNYNLLRNILLQVPQLKYLHLENFLGDPVDESTTLRRFKTHVTRNPLPNLPHLESLKLTDISTGYETVEQWFLNTLVQRYGLQLKSFQTICGHPGIIVTDSYYDYPLLESLHVMVLNPDSDQKYQYSFLVYLEQLNAPNLLEITLTDVNVNRFRWIQSLFTVLHTYFPLLQKIRLDVCNNSVCDHNDPHFTIPPIAQPKLGNATHLEIRDCRGGAVGPLPFTWMFKQLPNLEHVVLLEDRRHYNRLKGNKKWNDKPLKPFGIDQWLVQQKDFYQCPVWSAKPKLKTVGFGIVVQERSEEVPEHMANRDIVSFRKFTRERFNYLLKFRGNGRQQLMLHV